MTLAVNLTPTTPQNAPSHSAMHNINNGIANNAFLGTVPVLGVDPEHGFPALQFQLNHWDGVTNISALGPTAQITRQEMFPSNPPNPVSAHNGAALMLTQSSIAGNKNQPVALGIDSVGYSEGGLFNLGIDMQIRQNSGAQVGGNYGGAMAAYANVQGFFDHGAIMGYGTDVYNNTSLDGTSANGAQAAFDISVGGLKRFGSGIQLRINDATGGGADTGINFFGGGHWVNGIDFSGAVVSNSFITFDGFFGIYNISNDPNAPGIGFDNNDYLTFHRTDNTYHSVIGGNDTHFWGTGAFGFVGLRTTAPAAGSKQFWYTPADGLVHYVA